jgi:hypothetical protein
MKVQSEKLMFSWKDLFLGLLLRVIADLKDVGKVIVKHKVKGLNLEFLLKKKFGDVF